MLKLLPQFSVQETWKQSISPDLHFHLSFSGVQSEEKGGWDLSLCSVLIFPQYPADFVSEECRREEWNLFKNRFKDLLPCQLRV